MQALAGEPEFILRDKSDLDDYLYEPESFYSNNESQKVIIEHVLMCIDV